MLDSVPLDTSEHSGVSSECGENPPTPPQEKKKMGTTAIALTEKLSSAETKLLNELTRPDVRVEVTIPEDINPKDWMVAARATCRAFVRAQRQTDMLLPILGRLLLICKDNPQIYQENGYDSFEHFVNAEVREKFGVGRSTCYEAMAAVRFGTAAKLEMADYPAIGRVNFRLLTKAIPEGDEKKAFAKKLVEKAKTATVQELREHVESQGYVEKGETVGGWLRIPCNKKQLKVFEKFFADEDYQSYCGTGDRASMLEKAIAEATTEWHKQIEHQEAETTS